MDLEDNSENSNASSVHSKIKRGVIWGNEETSALIKVWGEAEIKYALSSLKRNIEIYEVISKELRKVGFFRTGTECRTKCKSLRKLYKQAVIQNSTSGAGRSKFIWYEEMANIFRTDTSIHPLRTTESETSVTTATTETMHGVSENASSQSLFEESEAMNHSYVASDASALESPSTDGCEPSTSGFSSSRSPQATLPERRGVRASEHVETTNYEATLDPATRLALLRKRKQRSTAAARLDNTLTGFVDWVRTSDDRKEATLNAWNHQDMIFQKEVIDNLRVASNSLARLTQFLTEAGTPSNSEMEVHASHKGEKIELQSETVMPTDSSKNLNGEHSDSDGETSGTTGSGISSDLDSDNEGSVSLLSSRSAAASHNPKKTKKVTSVHGCKQGRKLLLGHKNTPRTSTQKNGVAEPDFPVSPYLIVKQETTSKKMETTMRTPPKRRRLKKKIFSP